MAEGLLFAIAVANSGAANAWCFLGISESLKTFCKRSQCEQISLLRSLVKLQGSWLKTLKRDPLLPKLNILLESRSGAILV